MAATGAPVKGFERILPDNCVEYVLLIIEPEVQPRKGLLSLENVRKAAVQLSNQLTRDYIWQRDSFSLDIKSENGLHFLHGLTNYGDSIEDEWLIVYLIRELSKQFPTLWARVSDNDGEFLLVEAAKVLPKWLSPENDANRAWIHHGHLHIIPLQENSDQQSKQITFFQAVGLLQSAADALICSAFIEAEAFFRLEKYPGQIQEAMHHAMVTIPRRLAYAIHEVPEAIASAVEAFYLRDPVSLKPLKSTLTKELTFPPEDPVDVSVKLTKVLYAQLISQHFLPPPAWQKWFEIGFTNTFQGSNLEAQKKRGMLELGMKIACGFEMVVVNASKSKTRTIRELPVVLRALSKDGDAILPSNDDINSWENSRRDDDDSWMNIDFTAFEEELDGKHQGRSQGKSFEDASSQADIRKIVSRFEAFLNDDKAGIDGAEYDEMDEDEIDGDDESALIGDSESEDLDVSFDEEKFACMMREMMGLPAGSVPAGGLTAATTSAKGKKKTSAASTDLLKEDNEDEEMRKLSEQMEAELQEHGALDLNPTHQNTKVLGVEGKVNTVESFHENQAAEDLQEESEIDERDIGYNLAKNLLESFKGQAGLVGPVSTMLTDMGIRLPRDEDEGGTGKQDTG